MAAEDLDRSVRSAKRQLAISAVAVALATATAPVWAGRDRIAIDSAPRVAAAPASAVAAKEQLCASCHGRNGLPSDRTVAIIWGQQSAYIRKQLSDYRNGDRDSQIMSSIAESLSDREIAQIADHFGGADWPVRATGSPPAAPGAILACKACHSATLTGGTSTAGIAPRLAGQFSPYLFDTMTAFADGERQNSAQMSALMQSLSPTERKAIAAYLAAMP
jgi:cytochrome c553